VIVNLQRKIKIDAKAFAPFAENVIMAVEEAEDCEIAVAFVSDRRMKELNKFFRGKDSTTDVLSFPHIEDEFEQELPPKGGTPNSGTPNGGTPNSGTPNGGTPNSGTPNGFLGDIVISVEQAQKQAAENGLTLEAEIKQLMLHGVLHLCGYDHETDDGEMNERELELRDKLGL